MKVRADTDLNKVALLLNFMRHARGVRIAPLAEAHEMSRSNLTTFINSGGRPGSVSPEKACTALLSLGMHPDGTLRPGLHRWSVLLPELAGPLAMVLTGMESTWAVGLVLRQGGAYLMARFGRLIHVFAEVSEDVLKGLEGSAASSLIDWVRLDQDGDSATRMLWQNEDDPAVLDHFDVLSARQRRSSGLLQDSSTTTEDMA